MQELRDLFGQGFDFHAAYAELWGDDFARLDEAATAWREWEAERTL